ncbi:MAG: DUF378 domain-containing protein [Minisyncoccia bacterium]
MNNKMVHMVTFILLMVGGLNWLLIGLFNKDVVVTILGAGTGANVVYILVGLSALYELVMHKKNCTLCA